MITYSINLKAVEGLPFPDGRMISSVKCHSIEEVLQEKEFYMNDPSICRITIYKNDGFSSRWIEDIIK